MPPVAPVSKIRFFGIHSSPSMPMVPAFPSKIAIAARKRMIDENRSLRLSVFELWLV